MLKNKVKSMNRRMLAWAVCLMLVVTSLVFPTPAQAAITYQTSWIGNSGSNSASHIMQNVEGMFVTTDGKVCCITGWDEGGANVEVFNSDGTIRCIPEDSGTGAWGRMSGRAVTAEGSYLYQVMSQPGSDEQGGTNSYGGPSYPPDNQTTWYCVRRYNIDDGKTAGFSGGAGWDGSMLIVNTNGAMLTGVAIRNNELYVSDPSDNKIKVYDASTMSKTVKRSWSITRPGQLHFDKDGYLWMLQPKDSSNAAKLVRYSTTGTLQSQSITLPSSVIATGFGIDRINNKIYVTNNNADQNVLIYSNITSSPSSNGTFGNTGGIYSSVCGEVKPLKFDGPAGVGVDNSGNIYVACTRNGNCGSRDGSFGAIIEKYNSSGTSQWAKYGLEFVDVADADMTTDAVDVYTKDAHFVMDYSKSGGQEWTYKGSTINFFKYPNDPRKIINHNDLVSSPWIAYINGKKFMFLTNMCGNWLHIYRFNSSTDGETAIPAAVISGKNWEHFFPNSPQADGDKDAWIWVDSNGNGNMEASEYSVDTAMDQFVSGWWVEADGTVWRTSFDGQIQKFPCQGLNSNGCPIYTTASRQVVNYTDIPDLRRAMYVASEDAMYVSGYTSSYPNTVNEDRGSGRVLKRINNWSQGNRSAQWTTYLPYRTEGDRFYPESIAVAGNYIFVAYMNMPTIKIYKKSDGSFVGDMVGTGGVQVDAWTDVMHGVMAKQRSNGEYLVFLEDDGLAKVVMYRWNPDGAPSTTTKYEAENGTCGGGAGVYDDAAASGGKGVGWTGNQGSYVQVTVNVSTAGNHNVYIGYATDGNASKSVYVNGSSVTDVSVGSSGGWGVYKKSAAISLNLNAGNNTIKLQKDSDNSHEFDVDYIEVQ